MNEIKTEEDYRLALKELYDKMDSPEGSDDYNRAIELTGMIEEYELTNYPLI